MDEWLRLFLSDVPLTPDEGDVLTDEEALTLCLLEAFRGYGFTSPNPAVGCVILDWENRFLSSGYHAKAGEPHAEAVALAGLTGSGEPLVKKSGAWDISHLPEEKLRGAKVFVTLEPCAHEGRTPSCAKTLAKLPLAQVKAILRDPFPQVAGQGFEILKQAGLDVRCLEDGGEGEQLWVTAARAVCEFFLVNVQHQRSFVSLKVATSLDGMMALKNGESKWITNESSRDFARFLRGAHDAVLVGKNTVILDDPMMNARETPFADLRRKLVILDADGETLARPDLKIFSAHQPEDIFVCVGPNCSVTHSSHAQILRTKSRVYGEFLAEVLSKLWDRDIKSIWIEGGVQTLSACLAAGLGDRLWLFQGPHLLGGAFGRPWTEAWGGQQMQDRMSLTEVRHLSLGSDHLTSGRLVRLNP